MLATGIMRTLLGPSCRARSQTLFALLPMVTYSDNDNIENRLWRWILRSDTTLADGIVKNYRIRIKSWDFAAGRLSEEDALGNMLQKIMIVQVEPPRCSLGFISHRKVEISKVSTPGSIDLFQELISM